MRRTIGFVNVTASRTGATGVPRVNQEYRHASPLGFVGHERTKLEERPTVQGCPLRATNRDPLADATQIFQGNRSICVFRFGNQFFTDAVVGVFGKTAFAARKPFQLAFRRARTFGLQFGSQASVTTAHVVDVAGFVDYSITVNGNIGNAQVHPQRTFHVNGLWFVHFASSGEEEHSLVQPQVTFSLPCLEQFQLPLSAYKRDAKTPVYCPNRNGLVLQSPGQDAVIVSDATRCLEGALSLAVKFVSVRDFGNHPNRHLRRKSELLPYRLIALVMQVVLPKDFGFPRRITHKLTGGVGLFQRPLERVGLFGSREQFDLSYQLHANNYSTNTLKLQVLKLFVLAFLDIPLDGFRTDVTSRTNIVAFRPKCCVFAPILAAEAFKFFLQPARCYPFEQSDNFSRSKLWRCANKQMHMVGHNLNCQYLEPVLYGDLRQQLFQPCLNRPNQNLLSIARYPNQMVIDYIRAVWAVGNLICKFGFLWHRHILAKERGFLHPLKRGGFRREDL